MVVYWALNDQLGKVRTATEALEDKSAKTAATLSEVDGRLADVAKTAGELERNVNSVAATAKAAAAAAQLEAVYNRQVRHLQIVAAFSNDESEEKLAEERFEVSHGGVSRFWIHLGIPTDKGPPWFHPRMSLHGYVNRSGPIGILIPREEERKLISYQVFAKDEGVSPILSQVAHHFDIKDPDLRATKVVVLSLYQAGLRESLTDLRTQKSGAAAGTGEVAPVHTIRDLNDVTLLCEPARVVAPRHHPVQGCFPACQR